MQLPEAAESLIMDFAGPSQGEWFYLAQVSKLWRQECLQRFSSTQQTASLRRGDCSFKTPQSACFTKYSAVVASLSRLQLAIESGFNLYRRIHQRYNSWRVAHAAGRYADREVEGKRLAML
jgi:hypothetical protein